MHRVGWIFIALGALLLFGKAGFFFLPLLFFWPLLLLLAFALGGGRRAYGPWGGLGGAQPHYWRGRRVYGRIAPRPYGPCGGPAEHHRQDRPAERSGPYTGETTRL